MALQIPHDLLAEIENTTFKRKEARTLEYFKRLYIDGVFQLGTVKKELLTLDNDLQTNSEIYSTVNKQKTKLLAFDNKLNDLVNDLDESNQRALAIIKKCEEQKKALESECNDKRLHLSFLIEKLDKTIKEAIIVTEYDKRAEIILESSIAFVRQFIKSSKIGFTVGTVIGIGITPVVLFTVSTAILPVISACSCAVSFLSSATYAITAKKVKNDLKNCIELKDSVEELIIKLYEEIMKTAEEMKKLIDELTKINDICTNESKKPDIFRDVMSVVGEFRVIVRKWREPLTNVNLVFEMQRPPPSVLTPFKKREEKNIRLEISGIMVKAVELYNMFQAPQLSLTYKIEETESNKTLETKEYDSCPIAKVVSVS